MQTSQPSQKTEHSKFYSDFGLAVVNGTVVSLGLSVLFNAASATTAVVSAPMIALVALVTAACAIAMGINLRDAFRGWRANKNAHTEPLQGEKNGRMSPQAGPSARF